MVGEELSMMFYASWYKKDVAPKLTKEQKEKLLKKISDLSLRVPLHVVETEVDKKEFPELAPYAHTKKLSGLQLYAVMTEIFGELSKTKLPKPYPDFPEKKLRKVV